MKLSGLLVLSIFTLPTSAADTAIVFNGVIDKNCEVKIKNWDRILVAKSHDDMLFSGNVLFTHIPQLQNQMKTLQFQHVNNQI